MVISSSCLLKGFASGCAQPIAGTVEDTIGGGVGAKDSCGRYRRRLSRLIERLAGEAQQLFEPFASRSFETQLGIVEQLREEDAIDLALERLGERVKPRVAEVEFVRATLQQRRQRRPERFGGYAFDFVKPAFGKLAELLAAVLSGQKQPRLGRDWNIAFVIAVGLALTTGEDLAGEERFVAIAGTRDAGGA